MQIMSHAKISIVLIKNTSSLSGCYLFGIASTERVSCVAQLGKINIITNGMAYSAQRKSGPNILKGVV